MLCTVTNNWLEHVGLHQMAAMHDVADIQNIIVGFTQMGGGDYRSV